MVLEGIRLISKKRSDSQEIELLSQRPMPALMGTQKALVPDGGPRSLVGRDRSCARLDPVNSYSILVGFETLRCETLEDNGNGYCMSGTTCTYPSGMGSRGLHFSVTAIRMCLEQLKLGLKQ
jgi:hypothetical protein